MQGVTYQEHSHFTFLSCLFNALPCKTQNPMHPAHSPIPLYPQLFLTLPER